MPTGPQWVPQECLEDARKQQCQPSPPIDVYTLNSFLHGWVISMKELDKSMAETIAANADVIYFG